MNERQMCRKCFCLGYDLVPVNGEWSCLEHLSGHEAGAEIVRLNEQLAERTLQHQTQLDNAVDLTARLAEAEALLLRWHTDADGGGMDGVDCELMSDTDEYVLKHMPEAAGGCDA